jgi:hypothetical protein
MSRVRVHVYIFVNLDACVRSRLCTIYSAGALPPQGRCRLSHDVLVLLIYFLPRLLKTEKVNKGKVVTHS